MNSSLVYGVHAAKAALTKYENKIVCAYLVEGKLDYTLTDILKLTKKYGISCKRVKKEEITSLAGSKQHQGVLLQLSKLDSYDYTSLLDDIEVSQKNNSEKLFRLLILDEVQDPHNLGACLRSADAFGVDAVIIPKNRSAQLNGTVRKVACGAAEVVPVVVVTNLARAIKELQELGVWVVGTAANTKDNLSSIDTKQSLAVILGAEGSGMRRLTKDCCDQLVKIPMQGFVSSLNVSVSAGIVLYHIANFS